MAAGKKPSKARARVALHAKLLVAAAVTTAPMVGGCGYDVVDPIPPPADCTSIVDRITLQAVWIDDSASGPVIQVTLQAPSDRTDVVFETDLEALDGSTVVSGITAKASKVVVRVTPDAGTHLGKFRLKIDCDPTTGVPMDAILEVQATATHTAGMLVPATLTEAP
jgi:hypothetical protein